jgi:hypothetical protein
LIFIVRSRWEVDSPDKVGVFDRQLKVERKRKNLTQRPQRPQRRNGENAALKEKGQNRVKPQFYPGISVP